MLKWFLMAAIIWPSYTLAQDPIVNNYVYAVDSVERVVDGDTVDLLVDLGFDVKIKERVRFLDFDASEVRGGTEASKLHANLATERLRVLLGMGQVYVKTQLDKTGKYGRTLAELYVKLSDGRMIDVIATLKAEGYSKSDFPTTPRIQVVYVGE